MEIQTKEIAENYIFKSNKNYRLHFYSLTPESGVVIGESLTLPPLLRYALKELDTKEGFNIKNYFVNQKNTGVFEVNFTTQNLNSNFSINSVAEYIKNSLAKADFNMKFDFAEEIILPTDTNFDDLDDQKNPLIDQIEYLLGDINNILILGGIVYALSITKDFTD